MITVGLINEIRFISSALKTPICFEIGRDNDVKLYIKLDHGVLNVWHLGYHIWREDVDSDISMFGVESCSTIAEIVALIDSGSEAWREMRYLEDLD